MPNSRSQRRRPQAQAAQATGDPHERVPGAHGSPADPAVQANPGQPSAARMEGGGAAPSGSQPAGLHQLKHSSRLQFDKWALSYDRSWLNELVFFPSVRACQEEILRWNRARGGGAFRLLDVGCGTGNLLSILAGWDDAKRLVGLDFAAEMVARAAQKLADAPRAERLQVIHGDSERLPFADASFDILTCCNSFHHYPHQAAVVREFARVLAPGGQLVLIDGFRDNVIGWIVFELGVANIESGVCHAKWSDVRRMILEAGFASLTQRKLNVLAPLLVSVGRR